jgi:hypothetical protein
MDEMDYNKMGKEALRAECRDREISYGKLNNDGMRAALRADDASHKGFDGLSEFEMSQQELDAQQPRAEIAKVELGQEVEQEIAAEAATRPAPASRSRKGVTVEKDREERNGVKRPSKGGVCREVWDMLDGSVKNGVQPTAKLVRELAPKRDWNPNNAMIEFYQWRKFNGITGRVAK